jgi:hypothetical protein
MIEFQLPGHTSHSAISSYIRCGSLDRFWRRVDMNPHHCWEWQGYITAGGYGQVGFGKKVFLTHRVAYEIVKGPIPDGLHLDHLCRNRSCCNPDHLEPVTSGENTRRSNLVGRWRAPSCKRGHEFTPENTGTRQNGDRWCRECGRLRRAKLI